MCKTRVNYTSGAPLEEKVGYSRMVKVGPFIRIGGTTSVQPDGTVFGVNDPYAQAKYVLEKFIDLLDKANAGAEDVISVKCYTTDMAHAPKIGKAFTEIFFDVKPLFTMVGTTMLNRPTQLVEIELEAYKESTGSTSDAMMPQQNKYDGKVKMTPHYQYLQPYPC